ncbi:MAG TPA: lipopolysaccharide heptosyltransferase II [Vicinamibacterales bacterium]|jgi:heptosyltransferase-2|nr:lipopolysaccharide heptosyltransferase II [Vicinamibacterales bacterium]
MGDPSRLVVVSPNWLGDAVMALPAIADLRRRFPAAHLAVAARASVAPMFALAHGLDAVVTLRWKGRVFDRAGLRADAAALRDAAFDAAVLLPNSMASAWLLRAAGVPARWGYAADWRSPLLTRAVPKPRGSRHQAAYYQQLTQALDVPAGPLEPMLTAAADDVATGRALLTARGWDGQRPVIALAPGAAYGHAKRWPPERYAALVSTLVSTHGATCVLVGAPVDASATTLVQGLVTPQARPHVLDLAGATTLRALAGVLALAGACVSNDSGAMHLAAALGVRVVALFGPTREKETAPLARAARPATVLIHDVFCRPCMLRECPIDHRCMTGLDAARVEAAVAEAMRPTA